MEPWAHQFATSHLIYVSQKPWHLISVLVKLTWFDNLRTKIKKKFRASFMDLHMIIRRTTEDFCI